MKRVLTVFGTRPEAIKLFPLLHCLEQDQRFISRICVTGQHRAMLDPVLGLAGIVPHHDLTVMRPGQTLDRLTARLLLLIGRVIDREHPDCVVVQGDTAGAFAGALAAYYRQVPVAHVEAGLRSGDILQPWPEEVNRKAIATMAAQHFAPTQTAAEALMAENVDPASVHITGNTVIDALHWVTARIAATPSLAGQLADLERRFASQRIIGVTCHRREDLGHGIADVVQAVARLADRPDVAVIFPVHLNPLILEVVHQNLSGRDNVALLDPLDYPHFARLMAISHLMLTDSGGVQEEAPALGTPVLVMRETTERPEGVAAGTARLVGTDPDCIVAEAERLLDDPAAHEAMARAHNPYGDGRAAGRIADLLAAM
jgi:UDP-N-acetylglucosamine 2-epimerase (non-hydrolysing)